MLIFVYGSLKKGFYNHSLIEPFEKIADGTINGKMYSLGAFPAIVLTNDPNELIHGEVYDVNTVSGLRRLDCLEGYDPNSEDNFYDRVPVDCETTTGEIIKVHVYCFKGRSAERLSEKEQIKNGIWRENFYGYY